MAKNKKMNEEQKIEINYYCISYATADYVITSYTKDLPVIEGFNLLLTNIINKDTLSKNIIGEIHNIDYNSSILPKDVINLKELTVKIAIVPEQSLTWINVSKQQAEEKLKELSLQIYEAMVPTLSVELEKMRSIIEAQDETLREMQQARKAPTTRPPNSNPGSGLIDF